MFYSSLKVNLARHGVYDCVIKIINIYKIILFSVINFDIIYIPVLISSLLFSTAADFFSSILLIYIL